MRKTIFALALVSFLCVVSTVMAQIPGGGIGPQDHDVTLLAGSTGNLTVRLSPECFVPFLAMLKPHFTGILA